MADTETVDAGVKTNRVDQSGRGTEVKRRADLVIAHAGELLTIPDGSRKPKTGPAMQELGIIKDGAVAAAKGKIVAVGTTEEVLRQVALPKDPAAVVDARGKLVMPGLVDPHTHLIFAGSRENEYLMRLQGAKYMEIMAKGGGILSTVRATRAADEDELVETGRKYLARMLSCGATTVEAKSGYGLATEEEVKMLWAIYRLNDLQPVELASTFMGAHAIPPEYEDDPDGYVDLLCSEMIPGVAGEGLAEFCDVFCEEGVFTVDQTRRILRTAQKYGMQLKIHADEMANTGGAELAAELGAVSADHLLKVSEKGIHALAEKGVIAVLLPGTAFSLMSKEYAPARRMIEAGVPVALATDFNPGSSPVDSMAFILNLACLQMKMLPAEAITAATINAAHAVGAADQIGSLEVGKQADIIIVDAPGHLYLAYHCGANLVEGVVKKGKFVWRRNP
ncbi:MAG: imidazolonepropionase [Syntrophothermus sp.]